MRGKYSLEDPVAHGSPFPCPAGVHEVPVLSALKGDNAALFAEVARLWITPSDRVADVTAGSRVFWQRVPPQIRDRVLFSDTAEGGPDCRNLPYGAASLDVVVLDPPYQPVWGNSYRGGVKASYNLALDTMQDVLDLYEAAIREAARVTVPGGRLIVKCQDISFNHRLHLQHLDVLRFMTRSGFGLADLFVLLNQTRMPQPARTVRQERARRAHSYFLVGVKDA